ncbi:MAG: YdcF family protein, partial [Pseudomonadota bacterium]
IAAGIRLVEAGAAPRLLVSGVHPNVSLTDIAALAGGSSTVYDCCVELGHTAKTTLGNADETAEWVANNGYRRLIVVTSDYHLPRSLILLRDAMPGTELVGYPVRTAINPEQPFKTLRAFRGLASEWLKWRVTGLRDRRR